MDELENRARRDGEIARDLAALVSETSRDLPEAGETVQHARDRAASRAGGFPMAAFRFLSMRPLLSTAVAVALGLFVAFGLPIPFEKTVAHDVALSLAGPGLDVERVTAVAREMKSVLGADGVRVEAKAAGAGATYTLTASVPTRAGAAARRSAEALVAALSAAGYEAEARVTARTERVSGTVVAYAAERIVRVSMDGKSASEIAAEIRSALVAAGIGDAEVSVQDEGDGKTRIEVRVNRDAVPEGSPDEVPEIVLTKDGQDLDGSGGGGERCVVRVKKMRDASGAERLVVDVVRGDRTATVEVADAGAMSDEDLRRELQAQLDAAGIDVRVEVSGGRIEVESR